MIRTLSAALLLAGAPLPVSAQSSAPPIAPDPEIAAIRDAALSDDTAYAIVESVTTEVGPRFDGSAKEKRAREWAVAKMRALGLQNVRVEAYDVPTWERGVETGEVIAPYAQPLHLTALGNSGATPPGGLTLPVAYFRTLNELRLAPAGSLSGKIAFVSNQMEPTQDGSSYGAQGAARFTGPSIAASKGAAAIVIRSIGTDHSRAPHTGSTTFAPGVSPIPAAALSVADAANLERMMLRGAPVTLHLTLTPRQVGMRPSGNVVGEFAGTDPAAGIVLVGGHLDSWDLGTGAIDDGAGIAITAAAARLLDRAGPHRRTIRVVWFGDEEMGGFGGKAYAKAHAGEPHAMASESDFGADRVWRFNTNLPPGAAALSDRLAVLLAPLGIDRGRDPAGGGTDVEPMLATGVPAIELHQDGRRYFDWHHTAEDVLEKIDPVQLRQNVAAWAATLAVVARAPEAIGPVARKP